MYTPQIDPNARFRVEFGKDFLDAIGVLLHVALRAGTTQMVGPAACVMSAIQAAEKLAPVQPQTEETTNG